MRSARLIDSLSFQRLVGAASRRSATGTRNRAILWFLYGAGARTRELIALAPMDLAGTSLVLGTARPRSVPLPPKAMEAVAVWMERRPPSPWLFPTLKGGPLSDRYIRAMVARYAREAGLDAVGPSTLRRTYGVKLALAGAEVRQLAYALGVATPTAVNYIDTGEALDRDAMLRHRPGNGAPGLGGLDNVTLLRQLIDQEVDRRLSAVVSGEGR